MVAALGAGFPVPAADAAKLHGVVVRGKEVAPNVYASRQGFRRAVDFYRRTLRRQRVAHEAIPVYRHNGTLVARFLSQDPRAKWLAIHVFHKDGRTYVAVVPAPLPLTSAPPEG